MSSTMTACVREAIAGLTGWFSIDEAVEHVLQTEGEWRLEFEQRALRKHMAVVVRRAVKELRGLDGRDTFGSIQTVDEDGNRQRVYKQLTLCDFDERVQVRDTHVHAGTYHVRKANEHTRWINSDFQCQLPLPFPEMPAEE